MRYALRLFSIVTLAFLAGCYETTFFLGRADDAKIDRALIGRWSFDGLGEAADETATLKVTEFDAHRYKLDWTTHADGERLQLAGHVVEVKGAKFIHAGTIGADGKLTPRHFLIRFDLDGDALTVSHVDPEFMASRGVDSDASLRAVIEANVDNAMLYVPDVLLGKRAGKE